MPPPAVNPCTGKHRQKMKREGYCMNSRNNIGRIKIRGAKVHNLKISM